MVADHLRPENGRRVKTKIRAELKKRCKNKTEAISEVPNSKGKKLQNTFCNQNVTKLKNKHKNDIAFLKIIFFKYTVQVGFFFFQFFTMKILGGGDLNS